MEPTLRNPARDRLEAGELALGVGIRQSRTVDIASIMKACGYDWLFLDLEHNSMDLDTAVQISVAALGAGIARAHNLSDDAALHDGADVDRLRIGTRPADPAAHIRVEREIDPAHQSLAVARVGDRPVGNVKIRACWRAGRAPFQQHLSVAVFHALFSFPRGGLELADQLAHSKRH